MPKDKAARTTPILVSQQGFTLIEIIAVLILLGILAAVAVPKYIDMSNEAKVKALDAGISELNSRENLAWGRYKLTSPATWADATLLGTYMDTDLGSEYAWSGNNVSFQSGTAKAFTRTASTETTPGNWTRAQ
ncbi:MAG: prepilin-type N-terminal cleavage/methylation domain-containing protein [Thermodesulfobacteriota bacterium]